MISNRSRHIRAAPYWSVPHVEHLGEARRDVRTSACLAFPYGEDTPPESLDGRNRAAVPIDVAGDLLAPEVYVGGGQAAAGTAGMPVPEAAVDEDCESVAGKDHVRRAGETTVVQSVSEARVMEDRAHRQLRLSIAGPNARHLGALASGSRFRRRGLSSSIFARHKCKGFARNTIQLDAVQTRGGIGS